MQSSYIALAFLLVTAAGLSGALVGRLSATFIAFVDRWQVVRHVGQLTGLCGGPRMSS